MDFGISRVTDAHATMTGMVLGTPMYMSPEQLRGGEVDARSDLFATGAVFHEVLFGRPPFSAKSIEEAMVKLLYDELTLPPPTAEAPAPVLAVIARALAKPPEARFPTAQAMAAALREALATPTASGATIAPPPQSTLAPLGDPALLETIERRLAERIGPMASLLIRRARPGASSVGVLCERLAAEIDSPDERRKFLGDVRGLISGKATGGAGGPPSLPLNPAAITQIEAELARYMGPMAKVLVKRALPGATTVAELRERLAGNLEQPAERTAFLTRPPIPPPTRPS
jgi:serine/threonine-protein kinase